MKKIVETALASGAERCEVFYLNALRTEVEFENNRLKGVSNTEETGAALRVVKNGKLGLATTTKMDDADKLVQDALETSEAGARAEFPFAVPDKLTGVDTVDARVDALTVDEMITVGRDAVSRILDYENEILVGCGTTRNRQEIRVVTSEGVDSCFERTQYEFVVGGRLIEGKNMLDAWGYYGGTALEVDHSALVASAIEKFKNGRKNVPVSTGPTTVILAPTAVADVMMTLQSGVNGSMVERGISPIGERLGEQVFDERVSISDDGLMAGGHATAPFDDEGVPMQVTPVIEKGVLKSFLTDLKTSETLNHPRTGNGIRARRLVLSKDLGKVPGPEITNWVMAPGERSLDELLSEVKSGVLIHHIMGILMSNLLAGDFSGNLSLGFKIENGRIAGRVKDTMVAGNVYKLFKDNLIDISSDVERVGTLGGIGSHKYPYVFLNDVSISTKA